MDGIFRRGGVWYARLAIPFRLRSVVGKTEFVASTRVRDPVLARVVAAQLLAGWRRTLLDLTRIVGDPMDVERILAGHPALSGGGYLALAVAASASGVNEGALLRAASEGVLKLYYRCSGLSGHLCSDDEFEYENGPEGRTPVVPTPEQMSEYAIPTSHNGIVRLRDSRGCAMAFIAGNSANVVLFDVPENPGQFFAPARRIDLTTNDLEVSAVEVECLRKALASTVTSEQIELAKAERIASASTINPKSGSHLSEAVNAYMTVRARNCNADQARRVRSALDLLVELEGDPRLSAISSDVLEAFRDNKLVTVPAKENKVRQLHGTGTISESIRAVDGTTWPRLSPGEQVKRLKWISGLFAWLKVKEWIDRDPSLALVKESSAGEAARKARGRSQDARDSFTRDELKKIFSAGSWFRTGRGTLTAAGTYREFSPFYYWLPLLGLYTGGRINELSQLHLHDIRQTDTGTWFFDLAALDEENNSKRRKNANSKRQVPVHPMLVRLGLITWRNELEAAGYMRLFPELKRDETKGHGKAATKWFLNYLKRLGWVRNGKKTFHSFRATLATECINRLKLTPIETAQISGHSRGTGTLLRYVKDETVDHLVHSVARLDFNLPEIAAFDCDSGLKAVKDALDRKDGGKGASESR